MRAADAAFRCGESFLSDAEFDALVSELQRVDPSAPELLTPGGGSKLLSLGNQGLLKKPDQLRRSLFQR